MAVLGGSRAPIAQQLAIPARPLTIPHLYSRKHGLCYVTTGTFCLGKVVLSGHCCSEREALHHTDAALLTKKPGGRQPNKPVVRIFGRNAVHQDGTEVI